MVVDKIEHHNTDNGVYSNREYVFQNVEKDEDYLQKTVSNVKKNDARSEKNILLLAMSTLKKTLTVSRYTYEKKTLGSSHYVGQLEPLPKILAEVLAESNQRLDRIIVLNTRKTNEETVVTLDGRELKTSAFSFFCDRCKCLVPDQSEDSIISIDVEDEQGKSILNTALYKLLTIINTSAENGEKINLHVDIHGGMRNSSIVMNSIMTLLQNNGHIQSIIRYTMDGEFNGREYNFKNIEDDFKVFDFVSGINEFLSFGRSESLRKYIQNSNNTFEKRITESINKVSDDISLCRMELFNQDLCKLNDVLQEEKTSNDKSFFSMVNEIIEDDYKVTIDDRVYNLLKEDEQDLLAQIKWCTEKGFLQQALTLVESKLSDYLQDKQVYRELTPFEEKVYYDKNLTRITSRINSLMAVGIFSFRFSKNDKNFKSFLHEDVIREGYFNMTYQSLLKMNDLLKCNTVLELKECIHSKINPIYLEKYDNGKLNYDQTYLLFENKKNTEKMIEMIKNQSYVKKWTVPLSILRMPIDQEIRDQYLKDMYDVWFVEAYLKQLRNNTNHSQTAADSISSNDIKKMIGFLSDMVGDIIRRTDYILSNNN